MKRFKVLASLLFAMAMVLASTGCYKDIISPGKDPNGPPQFVSFSGDVVPIFAKTCAISGCHSAGAHSPILTADKAFASLTAGGFINTLVPDKSAIYTAVKPGGNMPTLNPADLQLLLDWIRNGAPNN